MKPIDFNALLCGMSIGVFLLAVVAYMAQKKGRFFTIREYIQSETGETVSIIFHPVTFRQWLRHHLKGLFFRFHISRRGVFFKCRLRQQ
jgi:hypothetical protein